MSGPALPPAPRDAGLRVRTAKPSDVDALIETEALAFASDRLSRRSLRALVAARSAVLLVAETDAVAGYALVLLRKNSRAARLYSLAVLPAFAGRGIGSRLLVAAENAAADRGADRLRLEVRADNAGAVRFYQDKGYVPFGRRDNYYADGMTALRLARPLNVTATRASPPAYREPTEALADG